MRIGLKKTFIILGLIIFGVVGAFAAERPWESILDEVVGFGENATGGAGGELCLVSNLMDSGKGSLRSCMESSGKKWIVFNVSGEINLNSPILGKSDKTLDGRGADITIRNYGINLVRVSNVVILNVKIRDGYDDAIKIISGSNNIWIDSVTLSNFKDGLIDITERSGNVTISRSRFENHSKGMLFGADERHRGDTVIRVTLYENFFDSVEGRTPRLRYGQVHMFNNYIYNWGFEGVTSQSFGEIYSEYNIFHAGRNVNAIVADDHRPWDREIGYAYDVGSLFLNDAVIKGPGVDSSMVFVPPYEYSVRELDLDFVQSIIANAGWKNSTSEEMIFLKKEYVNYELGNIDWKKEILTAVFIVALVLAVFFFMFKFKTPKKRK